MQSKRTPPIYSPLETLIYSPSQKVSDLIRRLAHEEKFQNKVVYCRELIGIKDMFSIDATKRKENFDEHLKMLPKEKYGNYLIEVFQILIDFNLPRNLYTTINYFIGTGLIFNSPDPMVVWRGKEESKRWENIAGFNILILESMTVSELIKYIKKHKDEINKEMKKLPKVKKSIKHKDGLMIGGFIVVLRDSLGKSFKEIADLFSELEDDKYKTFGASEPIMLSEKEVAIYYSREKKSDIY